METKIRGETYPITYEFVNNTAELSPQTEGGDLSMKIGVELEFDVTELGTANFSFHDSSIVASMEEQLAHYFNRRIREFVEKTQKEFGSDILGFGQMVRRQEPEIWRRYSQDWDAHLQELAIDVEVKCRIVLTGVRAYPITPRR